MPALSEEQYIQSMKDAQQKIVQAINSDRWRESSWFESFTDSFVQEIKRAGLFVDIGAELGFYTCLALKYMPAGGKIIAIEPDPVRCELMRELFSSYGNVSVLQVAAHDCAGNIELSKPRGQSATSADVNGEKFTVPAISLDTLIGNETVDVIKIDIEGGEAHAFKGMQKIIADGSATIFLELHYWIDEVMPGGLKLMEELLSEGGYKIFVSDNRNMIPINKLEGVRLVLKPGEKPDERTPITNMKPNFQFEELILDYTRVCNSHCTYCSIWKIEDAPELSVDEIENVLSAPQMKSLKSCYLTGGEPYISDKVLDIARLLKKHIPGCLLTGATNAIQVEKTLNRVLQIRDMGIEVQVQVSMNGTRTVHDATRGRPGYWEKCVTFIDKLIENGIATFTAFSIMPQTIKDLPYMQRFCASRGIGMEIVWVRQSLRYSDVEDKYASWHESVKPKLKLIENLPDFFDCPAMDKRIVVTPTGDVYPCEAYHPDLLLGNVKEKSLADILNDPRSEQIAQMIKSRDCTWCQGTGEVEGNPKWMVMDCYRRQSPQARETIGKVPQAFYSPPNASDVIIEDVLASLLNARPETVPEEELETVITTNRARSLGRIVPV